MLFSNELWTLSGFPEVSNIRWQFYSFIWIWILVHVLVIFLCAYVVYIFFKYFYLALIHFLHFSFSNLLTSTYAYFISVSWQSNIFNFHSKFNLSFSSINCIYFSFISININYFNILVNKQLVLLITSFYGWILWSNLQHLFEFFNRTYIIWNMRDFINNLCYILFTTGKIQVFAYYHVSPQIVTSDSR